MYNGQMAEMITHYIYMISSLTGSSLIPLSTTSLVGSQDSELSMLSERSGSKGC